jgi:NTE family protein
MIINWICSLTSTGLTQALYRRGTWQFVDPSGAGSPAVRRFAALLTAALLAGCTSVPQREPVTVQAPPASLPAAEPAPKRPPRIGLALGGGAAKGFAHVGVIAVLEQAGIEPSLVVGTSAGSLVAAFYASGMNATQLQATAMGLFRGEALARFVNDAVASRPIEDMRLPLGVVAADLANGQPVLFRRGNTGTAVRASSAVPAIFQPVRIGGRDYVDGGLVAPVPVQFARQMGAEFVIAVDISQPPEGQPASDTLQILMQTFNIMGQAINLHELKQADVLVRPSLVGLRSADFSARQRAIDAGKAAMQAALPELRVKLEAAAR